MISRNKHDVFRAPRRRGQLKRAAFSDFDGQRMAVVLLEGRKRQVLRGTAAFVRDDAVGNSLQILLEDSEPGQPILILAEGDWTGRIIPDFHHGCDYCVVID